MRISIIQTTLACLLSLFALSNRIYAGPIVDLIKAGATYQEFVTGLDQTRSADLQGDFQILVEMGEALAGRLTHALADPVSFRAAVAGDRNFQQFIMVIHALQQMYNSQ